MATNKDDRFLSYSYSQQWLLNLAESPLIFLEIVFGSPYHLLPEAAFILYFYNGSFNFAWQPTYFLYCELP